MMNETLKIMEERSSCEAFTDELPEKELLDAITKAAIESPSGTNAQPRKIITVTNKELLDEMEEETLNMMSKIPAYKGMYDTVTSMGIKLFYGAPCMIVLPYDKNNAYAKFDCGIVSQVHLHRSSVSWRCKPYHCHQRGCLYGRQSHILQRKTSIS